MDRFERCIDSEVDVLQSHTADLNGVLAANPSLLGQNLVQYHFASQTTVDGIVNTPAVPPYQTTAKLLSLVDSKIRTAGSKERTRKYFNDFLTIVAGPMGCRDIAQRLDNAMSKDPTYERFNQPTSTNSLPGEGDRFRDRDFNDIYFKLSTRAHKWREIGSALNFSKDEIKNIESAVMLSAQGSKGYLRELLSQWLEWAPGDARGSTGYATRESLVAALRKANLGVLVEKFENTNAAMPRANDVLEIPPTTATNKPIQQQGKHSTHVVTNKNTEAMSEANESDAVEMPPTTATNKPIQQQGKRGTHVDSEIPIFAKKDMETVYDEKQPQQCPDDLEEAAKKFSKEAVILLVTVNLEELVAVYKLLKPPDMGSDLPKAITYRPNESIKFILGKFGNHDVVVIQASPGADCRHDVQAAVESLPSVQLIIAVGCAYGRRDKCALGDVLVSTSILAVSNSRAEGGKFIDDEKSGRRVTLLARERNTFAKQYNMMKFNCIKSEKKERNSEVHLGLIISGATLWNDKNLLQNVIDKHGRFIGGEMEGQELSQLAVYFEDRGRKVEIIIIKGVSDFGDGSKTQEWQYTASLAAATYAESKLQATPKMVYKLPVAASRSSPTNTTKVTFHCLNVEDMSNEENRHLYDKLFAESVDISYKFQDLFSLTTDSLRLREIPVKELGRHLECLGNLNPTFEDSGEPVFRKNLRELKKMDSVDDAMSVINNYCSFFNYRMLEHIINKLGVEQDKANLARYEEDFARYGERHVFECPDVVGQMSEEGQAKMLLKLDESFDNCSVNHLYAFVKKLANLLKMNTTALRLCRINPGCLELIFQLPLSVQRSTFPLSIDQGVALAGVGVTYLSCGDYQFTTQENKEVEGPASDGDLGHTDSEGSVASLDTMSHPQRLNHAIDDKCLGQIADGMDQWEGRIADELGLSDAVVAAIKHDNPRSLMLQKREALKQWKKGLGDNATYINLIRVFEQAGYQNYADSVKKVIPTASISTGQRYYERDQAGILCKLKDHAAKWRDIGTALGFKEGELENIQANLVLMTQSPPLSYLRQMVSQWLQWAPGDGRGSKGFATKESLIAALLKADLGVFAEKTFGYQPPEPMCTQEDNHEPIGNDAASCPKKVEVLMPPESPRDGEAKTKGRVDIDSEADLVVPIDFRTESDSEDLCWCEGQYYTESKGLEHVNTTGQAVGMASLHLNKLWDIDELHVKFLNDIPKDWVIAGGGINLLNIKNLAYQWNNKGKHIPKLKVVKGDCPAHIRVCFTDKFISHSVLGVLAQDIRPNEPTMYLNLKIGGDDFKMFLVVHEFGHALGLEHEHQRGDFWKLIEPYVDEARMKNDLGTAYDRYIADSKFHVEGRKTSKYDPKSVMHYWFKSCWLKKDYNTEGKIKNANLHKEVKDALLGVLERSKNVHVTEPSEEDIKFLDECYEERKGESTTNSNGKGNTAPGALFGAPTGQVAQQLMGGARFGQPSAVPGFIPPQQQWVQPQQVQPGMMGGVQQMPTQQFWGQLLQPGSHWVAGGQFVGGMVQLAGFAGAQPQQPLGGFASVPQQQPQQLMQANAGGGQQQHPVSQSFVGGGVQHPQQPPPPTGGATNPFASGSGSTNPFL